MRLLATAMFLLGYSCTWVSGEDEECSARVTTTLGTYQGFCNYSRAGKKYEAFQGIRFALPPTKEYRFKMARPVTKPWQGVVEAINYGASCIQSGAVPNLQGGPNTDNEDCLFLNVYTPVKSCRPKPWLQRWDLSEDETSSDSISNSAEDTSNEDLDDSSTELFKKKIFSCSTHNVIVFIHGGAFRSGNTRTYRPTYIMDLPLVFVEIAYRLGPLGFLSTQDNVVPGNLGLKDQVVALRWVKKYIKYFGGDPRKITIVGQSAGGASVQYHYLTDVTKDLFWNGMSLSGTALNCWTETEGSLPKARRLATLVNCPNRDTREMIECMRNRSATAIVQASSLFSPWVYNPITPFGPTVEKWDGKSEDGDFNMIPRFPYKTLKMGKAQKKDWITSVVAKEGLFPAAEFINNRTLLKELNDHWDTIAPWLLDYSWTVPKKSLDKVSEIIRKHYFGDQPVDNSTVDEIVHMVTDRLFKSDAGLAAKLQAKIHDGVWFYDFAYRQINSLSNVLSNTTINWGTAHTDDLLYVLDAFFNSTTTPKDLRMQKFFLKLWLSFAEEGKPQDGVRWDKVEPTKDLNFLHIYGPEKMVMEEADDFGEEDFWHSLRFNENRNRHRSFPFLVYYLKIILENKNKFFRYRLTLPQFFTIPITILFSFI